MTAGGAGDVSIRRFIPGPAGDEDAVVGVWERASAVAHPFLTPEFAATERRSLREVYLPRTQTWVAERDGVVVGFLSLLESEIGSLFVEPALHGAGIGRALVARAGAGLPALEVQVYERNSLGRGFYARLGFEFVSSCVQSTTGEVLLRLRLTTGRTTEFAADAAPDVGPHTSVESARDRARGLARAAVARGRPLEWFEELYRARRDSGARVPWADLVPNPELVAWAEREQLAGRGARALVVGCGAGDDAEYLASRGYRVSAFDIAPAAVAWCRERFPESSVEYLAADLFDEQHERGPAGESWEAAFELVFEAFTLQVLPPALQGPAMAAMAARVAPGGRLLAIARGRDELDPRGELPWPLAPEELTRFTAHGLVLVRAEDFLDREQPPVRRLRFEFRRPASE